MFPIITPVYLPQHDPEEDKVECPKCHHRFIPEDDGCNGYCFIPAVLWFLYVLGAGVLAGLNMMGLVNTPEHAVDLMFGGGIIGIIAAFVLGVLIHMLTDNG